MPKGSQWRTLEFDRKRDGTYAAVQWKKDNMESSLTYFQSKYKMQWDENAIFAQIGSPHNISVANGQWDGNGALTYGTLSMKDGSKLDFGADTRTSLRNSTTRDVGWNFTWRPDAQWTLKSDLQFITAKTNSFDSTVATGARMAKETLDLRGSIPSLVFDDADRAALAPTRPTTGPSPWNTWTGQATEKAWKGDAKHNFTDSDFFRPALWRFRIAERDAETTNSTGNYHWAAITQPWQVGWNISGLAPPERPRASVATPTRTSSRTSSSKASVPSLIMPTLATATGFPTSYAKLQGYHDILCAEQVAAQGWGSCDKWTPAVGR